MASSTNAADQVLRFDGLGPVRIGMTLSQIEDALGTKLKSVSPNAERSCWFGRRADDRDGDIHYMIEKGIFVRIGIENYVWPVLERVEPHVKTEQGIGIGSTLEDVKRAYANVVIYPDPQADVGDEDNLIIAAYDKEKKFGLVFAIAERKVDTFQGGFSDSALAYEPCI